MKNLIIGKSFITGFILGFILCAGTTYALRLEKPTKITKFDDSALLTINNALEQIWNLSNGQFNLNVMSSAPTWTSKEGDIVSFSSGGVYRIYIYLNSGWRVWTSD